MRSHHPRDPSPRRRAARPSPHAKANRALLEGLVERERQELEDLGVEVSLSSVMRKLIRAAAKASAGAGVGATAQVAPSAKPVPTRASADVSQDQVRALLQRKTAERRGLGAELARILVEASERFFPERTLRHALRTLGRSSPDAFLASILGRVTLGSTREVHSAVARCV